MANQRILRIKTNITDRASNIQESSVIPPVEKDIVYSLFAKDITRFNSGDNLVTIPLSTVQTIKFVRLEARYTQDDPSATPSPVVAGDLAPFKVRLNGVVFDMDVNGGIFEFHGTINQLQVSTAYAFAQTEIISVIAG